MPKALSPDGPRAYVCGHRCEYTLRVGTGMHRVALAEFAFMDGQHFTIYEAARRAAKMINDYAQSRVNADRARTHVKYKPGACVRPCLAG